MDIDELLAVIKDAAYQVRKGLSYGFLESVYQNALIFELRSRGIKAEKETPIAVHYKGVIVGEFRADILVDDKVIIEIKAVRELNAIHEIQLVNYLSATGLEYGYLINYGSENYRIIRKTRTYTTKG